MSRRTRIVVSIDQMALLGWGRTSQRAIILKAFQDLPKGESLSPEDLCRILEEAGEHMSLSRSYRNLKMMVRLGILQELEFSEGQKRYEIREVGEKIDFQTLSLEIEIAENASINEISTELATLLKALNACHIAYGGNGIEIDDWKTTAASRALGGI